MLKISRMVCCRDTNVQSYNDTRLVGKVDWWSVPQQGDRCRESVLEDTEVVYDLCNNVNVLSNNERILKDGY